MAQIKVLFICIHNSARSQMAEAYLKEYGMQRFVVSSAGIEPGTLNQTVVAIMKEENIDISSNKTTSVFDLHTQGNQYNFVITVCDIEAAEKCPIFPGNYDKLHWGFKDPSSLQGDNESILANAREIRDQIKEKVLEFIKQN